MERFIKNFILNLKAEWLLFSLWKKLNPQWKNRIFLPYSFKGLIFLVFLLSGWTAMMIKIWSPYKKIYFNHLFMLSISIFYILHVIILIMTIPLKIQEERGIHSEWEASIESLKAQHLHENLQKSTPKSNPLSQDYKKRI